MLAYMVACKQAKERVEGFNAPLGTFSSRIKAAYSIGLLLNDQHDDLDWLATIRLSGRRIDSSDLLPVLTRCLT